MGETDFHEWLRWQMDLDVKRWTASRKQIMPDEFTQAFHSLNYNSSNPLAQFSDFLGRPNFYPIDIGSIRDPQGGDIDTHIALLPAPARLDMHPAPEHHAILPDYRTHIADNSILGFWDTPTDFRRGEHSDEGLFEAQPEIHTVPRPSSASTVNLEVVQQLGIICWKKVRHGQVNEDKFQSSNYVLVANVYDDSLWVIWKSCPMNVDEVVRKPAKESLRVRHNYLYSPEQKVR